MNDTVDVARVRADTPAVSNIVHLNNAGAGLMPMPVLDAVKQHLDLEVTSGGYEAARMQAGAHDGVYASLARLIGADADEIALLENATDAWQRAFYAIPFASGDRILTVRAEYAANYVAFLQMAQRTGCSIEVIPDDSSGATDVEALARMIDGRVKLIAVTWIPTNGGLMNPAAEIGRIARANGIPYLLDACQAVGQLPVNVDELGCDFLSATGRKFLRGPRGTGFLYVRRTQLAGMEPAWIDHFGAPWTAPGTYELRSDARRFETWESSIALHLGLGAAAEYALDIGLDAIAARAFALADHLRSELAKLPDVEMRDAGDVQCAIVSFSNKNRRADELARYLGTRAINVSVSIPSSTLLDAEARGLPPLVRVSPHYYNTQDEIDALVAALREFK